jgi:subtilisin family serine protease
MTGDRAARGGARSAVACASAALACVAGGGALAPVAQAGVTPELEQVLRRSLPFDRIPVVATLREQAAPSHGEGPAGIIEALQRTAGRTQPGLLSRVALTSPRAFWLVNALAASALPTQIRPLAADRAVATVDLDPAVAIRSGPAGRKRLAQAGALNRGLDAIRARQAWRATGVTGASVRVGSIDTGVDARHPALAGRIAGWRDVIAGRAAPYDDNGHGTHTAGVIAGGDPGAPVGVAPGAKLLVAKAIRGDGRGMGSDILAAAQWLADPDGNRATADFPSVVNSSWGQAADPNDVWFRPMIARWRSLGIVAVFAAGNGGPRAGSVGSPSSYPEALAVGAVDGERGVAPFSSRGPVDWQNRDGAGPAPGPIAKPDLVAPGVDVVSSITGGYAPMTGTSMAAPHVAGVAALVRSANPTLTVPQVEQILRTTAADVGPPGPDAPSGAGRVDALAATRSAAGLPGARARAVNTRRALRRATGRVRVTVAQLRINRRIALTAAGRVGRLETLLAMTPGPAVTGSHAPIRRLSAQEMRLTQRIAQSALRRATAVRARVEPGASPSPAPPAASPRRVALTVGQLRIDQRIAQAALRRVGEAESVAQASGMLPPG